MLQKDMAAATTVETEAVLALQMRSVVFAGHDVAFSLAQGSRHRFGLTLLRALCAGLRIQETCGQHAMMLWTISMSTCARGTDMDVCVACLMVSAKMHESRSTFGLSRFGDACKRIFESRQQTALYLEAALLDETGSADALDRIQFLTSILKMFDCVALCNEVRGVTAEHLKYAERFLLFTSINGRWYRYLIELYEYTMSKMQGMSRDARMRVILEVCAV